MRWHQWMPTITKVEPIGAERLAVGNRFRIQQPKLLPCVWTVTEVDPLRGFAWETRAGGVRMRAEHSLHPGPDGTCRLILRMTFFGILGSVLGIFYGRLTQRYLEIEAESLRKRIEEAA